MNKAMFYSWMSQASYLYFDNSQLSFKENDVNLISFLKDENLTPKQLEEHSRKDKLFSETQAKLFVEKYSFVSHQPNTLTGMSSTVFQSKTDGSYTFAMRGTEPSAQGGIDAAIEDLTGVVLAGKAKAQLADAFHYYKRLTTPQGETVKYTSQERQIMAKLLLDNSFGAGQFSSIEAAEVYIFNTLSQDTGLGEIKQGDTINFTGHSLGGHLAYLLATMVHASCEGRYQIGDIMTYNAPGQNALFFEILNWIGIDTSTQAGFIGGKHIAFYAEQGVNVTAGLGQVVGTPQAVFIESDPSILAQLSADNHSIARLSDTFAVYNIFKQLDKGFYSDISANNINKALPILNKIFENSTGSDYQSGLENILDKLDKLLDPKNANMTPVDDKEAFYQKVQRLTEKSLEVKKNYDSHIEMLGNINDITQAALQDKGIAYRYALKELNVFALTEYDYSSFNQNGELNLWSVDNQNGMTDEYIEDRAKMLLFKMQYDAQNIAYSERLDHGLLPLNVNGDVIYSDAESNIQLDINGVNLDTFASHYVRFGSQGKDELTGGDLEDKLYGGLGNDKLDGGLGDDYLEGGDGHDILKGEDGNDRLIGGNGIDSLDGGIGADRLEGGKDFDLYHVDNGDTVFDEDGKGVIFFNGGDALKNFHQEDKTKSIWYELDKENNKTGLKAEKKGNDLIISNGDDSQITIENYFQVARRINNEFEGLNIQLLPKEEIEDQPKIDGTEINGVGKYNQINIYDSDVKIEYYGRQTEWDGLGLDYGVDGAIAVYRAINSYYGADYASWAKGVAKGV